MGCCHSSKSTLAQEPPAAADETLGGKTPTSIASETKRNNHVRAPQEEEDQQPSNLDDISLEESSIERKVKNRLNFSHHMAADSTR